MAKSIKKVETEEIEDTDNPSTTLLKGALSLVKDKYGIDENYTLLSFKDTPHKVQLTLATSDFNVQVSIRGETLFNLRVNLGLIEK